MEVVALLAEDVAASLFKVPTGSASEGKRIDKFDVNTKSPSSLTAALQSVGACAPAIAACETNVECLRRSTEYVGCGEGEDGEDEEVGADAEGAV